MRATSHDYAALMRLDKPIGIWLVFFPAAWGVLLSPAPLRLSLLALMLLGAVVVRAAGCILNDIADRQLDARVERTKNRPLASGRISLPAAIVLAIALLLVGLGIALLLPRTVLLVAIFAVPLIAAYPWMKRITYWPQLFLGITFNLGAIMGWLATGAPLSLPPLLLYAACIFWTLAYDTVYALQDMEDDKAAGVKSTALALGDAVPRFVAGCFLAMQLLLIAAGASAHAGPLFFLTGLIPLAVLMRHQLGQLRNGSTSPGSLFCDHQWLGLCVLIGFVLDRLAH